MEGEGGADSGAPPASPPRPPLAYEHLAFFEETRCIQPEHELAVKQHLYNRTFGIAHIRGFASRAPIFQMMQSLAIKRTIWRYLDVAKPVALAAEIVTPETSVHSRCTVTSMLAGTWVWCTDMIPAHQVESVVLGVAAGSRVMSFDVASFRSRMCVEEFAADDAVGATLIAWNNYGTRSGGSKRSNYTLRGVTFATIAVETTATRFKVCIRHTQDLRPDTFAGVAIFRATGVAP